MGRQVTVGIPEDLISDIEKVRPEEWEEIVRLGLHQYKIERALALYRAGAGSLGYVAEKWGVPKQELIRTARMRGIEPEYDEEMVQEELAA